MHRPLRTASAEPATLTSAAAYEGAVMITDCLPNHALTCPYIPMPASTTGPSTAAAKAVA